MTNAGPQPAERLEYATARVLLEETRALHEAIRRETAERLERARADATSDELAAPGGWRAGDLTYALDDAVDPLLDDFVARVLDRHPITLVAEGPGTLGAGERAAGQPVRVLVDPIDGTRSLMHDLRSAWVVTGVAPDRGDATRLSDVQLAVQTELVPTGSAVYHVIVGERGRASRLERRDFRSGRLLEERTLRVPPAPRLDNGYFCFTRYLPDERPLVARLEQSFLRRAIAEHGLSTRLIYDDQYLCSAGQLWLAATGRYRMAVDLRRWLRRVHGGDSFTAKPYDVGALLAFREAGLIVLDADMRPLDAPLDTETPLDLVVFPDERVRAAFQPLVEAAMEELAGGR